MVGNFQMLQRNFLLRFIARLDQLDKIANLRAEIFCTMLPFSVSGKESVVIFEEGRAARCSDQDRFERIFRMGPFKGVDRPSGAFLRKIGLAHVKRERAAAAGTGQWFGAHSSARQNTSRSGIDCRCKRPLHAAFHERDALRIAFGFNYSFVFPAQANLLGSFPRHLTQFAGEPGSNGGEMGSKRGHYRK